MLHFNALVSHVWSYPFVYESDTLQPIPPDSSVMLTYYTASRILLPVQFKTRSVFYIKTTNHSYSISSIHKMYLTPYSNNRQYWLMHGWLLGLVFGGLFVILMYSIIAFIKTPKKVYFFYFLYIFCAYISMTVIFVVGEQFWVKDSLWFSNKSGGVFLLAFVFYFLFIREVTINDSNRKTDRILFRPFVIAVTAITGVEFLLLFINELLFVKIYNIILPIYSFIGLILVLLLWRSCKIAGRFVLAGMVVVAVSGLATLIFWRLDMAEENHFFNIGTYIEMILFTLAMIQLSSEMENDNNKKELAIRETFHKTKRNEHELIQKVTYSVQQEQLLEKLKTQLLEINEEDEQTNKIISSVSMEIDRHMKQPSWEEFERYFTEVHPMFYRNLKNIYPALSQLELRVCAMIKLNLNTKQMVDISGKTINGINVARTRIRQKMRLGKDENISGLLSKI